MKHVLSRIRRPSTCIFAAALLAPLCGCIYVSESTWSSSSVSDAHSITNRALAGDISKSLKSLEVDNRYGLVHVVAGGSD